MSHGGGDDIAEPDLTPMLDLILQLLMFFIINVNFVSEQVSADIKLPSSESARPIDKADPGAIFLGQKVKTPQYMLKLTEKERERFRNFDSIVLIPTQPPMSPPEAKAWLKDKHEFLVKLKGGEAKVDTIIYFRPDADLEYGEMTKLMTSCKVAGFTRIKVRAQMKRAGS